MNLLAVDITNVLKLFFKTIYDIYNFLNTIEFVAFGHSFTLLGIMLSFLLCIAFIKFMRFGFESSLSDGIKFSRAENKESYFPKHGVKEPIGDKTRFKSRWI